MGTNYYLRRQCCPCCKRGNDIHIGKSSGGWHFSLHIHPEEGINNLDNWRLVVSDPESRIFNEYDEELSPETLWEIITERSNQQGWDSKRWYGYRSEEEFHSSNDSERGLNCLLRHKIGSRCVGHGPGTYDYITGDFS
jgi:hypothetical protein